MYDDPCPRLTWTVCAQAGSWRPDS